MSRGILAARFGGTYLRPLMKILNERNDDWLDQCDLLVGRETFAARRGKRCCMDYLHYDIIGE